MDASDVFNDRIEEIDSDIAQLTAEREDLVRAAELYESLRSRPRVTRLMPGYMSASQPTSGQANGVPKFDATTATAPEMAAHVLEKHDPAHKGLHHARIAEIATALGWKKTADSLRRSMQKRTDMFAHHGDGKFSLLHDDEDDADE